MRYALSIIFVLFVVPLFAQDATDLLEQDINLPKTTLIQETIEELIKNPLNLNSATYEDLIRIPYLTPILAYKIIQARKSKGSFQSMSEIVEILDNDYELFEKVKPLITIKQQLLSNRTTTQFRFRCALDTITNISQTRQWEVNTRVALSSFNKNNRLKIVLVTDKDANEKTFADFFSTSASITTKHTKLILGNYVLNFGSQLLFSGPYSYISSIKNFSLDPLKSFNELNGAYEHSSLFGLGFSQVKSNWGFYSFLSSILHDADEKNGAIRRVYYYTKYTDSTSQARRNILREDLIGFRIANSISSLIDRALVFGLTAYHNQYNKPFTPTDSTNSFYGSNLNIIGLDVQAKSGNYFMKSEVGYCVTNGFGGATQFIGDWQFLRINLTLYGQQKDFFSPHSKWRTLTNHKSKITGSFNLFYNLSGFKMYVLTSTQQDFTTDSLPARVQYRLERRQKQFGYGITLKGYYKESVLNTYGTRFDFSYHIKNNFELYARLEDRYLKTLPKFGRLFYFGGKLKLYRTIIDTRFYCFNIASYDCKIYTSEINTESYGFNGKGIRLFTSTQTEIRRWLKFNCLLGYTKTDKNNFNTALQFLVEL